MPRNRPSAATLERRGLVGALGELTDLMREQLEHDRANPDTHVFEDFAASGQIPVTPAPRLEPRYLAVGGLGITDLGCWVSVLPGTYDPELGRSGAGLSSLDITQAVGGRLVGFAPSGKARMDNVPWRSLILQQGGPAAPFELWSMRPALVAPREWS